MLVEMLLTCALCAVCLVKGEAVAVEGQTDAAKRTACLKLSGGVWNGKGKVAGKPDAARDPSANQRSSEAADGQDLEVERPVNLP